MANCAHGRRAFASVHAERAAKRAATASGPDFGLHSGRILCSLLWMCRLLWTKKQRRARERESGKAGAAGGSFMFIVMRVIAGSSAAATGSRAK